MKKTKLIKEDANSYHSKTDFIGSSAIAKMLISPAHFYHAWTEKITPTDAMDRGTFMHKLILEQDISEYCKRPLNEKGELVRSNSKEYAEFLKANQGKTPLHPDLFNDAMDILTAACAHKPFIKLLGDSHAEQSFYGTHKETGLKIKARCDLITKDLSTIIDVKSTNDISRFERQIFDLGYDVRLAHYAKVIEAQTGMLPLNLMFFAIESSAPYGSKLIILDREATDDAFAAWDVLANQVKACLDDNSWPGFSMETKTVSRPSYMARETINLFEEAM